MADGKDFGAAWRTLGIPNYRNYMVGNIVSQVGLWTQRIGVQWLTWKLTGDPFWLGLIAFSDLFPIVVMAPLGGAMADRGNPIVSIRIYVFFAACISTAIAGLTLTDHITIEILALLVFTNGCVMAFNYPVRISVIHTLVGREALTSAIGLNSVGFNMARVGGPALAGWLIARWSPGTAISFTIFANCWFIGALFFVRLVNESAIRKGQPLREIPNEIRDGYRYVRNHTGLAPLVVILVAASVLGRPFTDLFAGFADDVFGRGSDGLATLTAMQGLGAALGSVVLASYSGVAGLTRRMVFNMLVLSLAVIAFTATDAFWFACACTVVAGYALVVVGVIEQTLMQASVQAEMRGRVASLYTAIARGCPAFGAFIMGYLASYFGLRIPIAVGAALCILLWLWARQRQDGLAALLETEPEEDAANT